MWDFNVYKKRKYGLKKVEKHQYQRKGISNLGVAYIWCYEMPHNTLLGIVKPFKYPTITVDFLQVILNNILPWNDLSSWFLSFLAGLSS